MHLLVDGMSEHMRIWVADDDADMRALVIETLRASGHDTCEARDGEELLGLLLQAEVEPSLRPDVLITDVKMPRLSGLGVLESLRSGQWRPPVIVITVLSESSIHTAARRLGAIGVLQKPFDPEDLLTAVHNAKLATEQLGH
ncbi:MAG: response regulator [Polyangiaceae bacterium]|jgi:DNA-binding response OmpR family regulator